ncbi:acyl-CoA dehydrogenase family protein [Nocardioides astragali]|uniref:Acyl-CoA dehydrogenase family protein n=1 Tax=Nocardioides astragali TaxID=1776736 RepID=A0ABW2N7K9_9ACTN|nr:acyl-CoA dehydrogenase family protein [Nocardioides astragali]
MSDLDELLDQILGRSCAPGDGLDSRAWRHLTESGLDRVGIPEHLGGVGGDLVDAGDIVIRTAQAGLISPLRETLFPVAKLAELRDHAIPEGVIALDDYQVKDLSPAHRQAVRLWHALGVAAHSLGAIRGAVDQATSYVAIRHQFGRPLASHQVVRHQIASIVSELCACEAAVSHALAQAGSSRANTESVALAIASAKIQTARSSTRVARTAHQVHGAIGMTAEHPLHYFTTQLWTLPREAGGPELWSQRVYDLVHSPGQADLWAALCAQHQF